MLQASKDELESHYSQQASLINDLQSKNVNLTLETETHKRQISELNQVVANTIKFERLRLHDVSRVRGHSSVM